MDMHPRAPGLLRVMERIPGQVDASPGTGAVPVGMFVVAGKDLHLQSSSASY
jgi:hypothetical protein